MPLGISAADIRTKGRVLWRVFESAKKLTFLWRLTLWRARVLSVDRNL
jgi:hypothetical protein